MRKNKVFLLPAALILCLVLAGCQRQAPNGTTAGVTEESATTVPTSEATVPTTEAMLPTSEPTSPSTEPQPVFVELADSAFVSVEEYLPSVPIELKYATTDNFTGQVIYDFQDVYLRYGTVKKLAEVQQELEEMGLSLKIWDGFRPVSAQYQLWEVCPDPTYVANPETGYSSHSRGNTVDLTLIDQNGTPIEMPTGFDDFSSLADRDYSDCTEAAANHAQLLQNVMESHGFKGYYGEWWHFSDQETYPVEKEFQPVQRAWYYAECDEFISLRTEPDTSGEVMTKIPVNGEFQLLARYGDFFLVDYDGLRGYVLSSYTRPAEEKIDGTLWQANCEEYISLRKTAGSAEVIAKIPAGATFTLEKCQGQYALVAYNGQEGYVLTSYIKPESERYFSDSLDTVIPTDSYSYDQMRQDMTVFQTAYPDIIEVETIGTSELGREIPVLRIGNPDAEYHILLQGAIHGREHMTAWLIMAMADYWLDHDLLSTGDICYHLIPMTNPDGVMISQSQILTEKQREIYQNDLDSGYTSAKEKKYALSWKANGLGIDLNRNFSSGWQEVFNRKGPSSQQYRGESPFCAAETMALRDYTLRYPFAATISYHASGSVIYYSYGSKQPVNSDSKSLAQAVKAVTGYPLETSADAEGAGYKDWAIDALEIPSLTVEIGCQEAPLALREIYSIFARNLDVLPAIARWVQA